MLCQLCGKKAATVCIMLDINGEKRRQYICEDCANERKLKENPSPEVLLSFMNDIKKLEQSGLLLTEDTDIKCPECRTEYRDFLKTKRLGCAGCYEAFAKQLKKIFAKTTKPEPEKIEEKHVLGHNGEILKLHMKLKQCVEKEDYEQAAIIRDKINELRSQEGGSTVNDTVGKE